MVGVGRVAEYTGSLLRAVYGDGHPDVAATLLSVARLKEQVGWTAAAARAMWRSVKQLEDGRTQPVHSAMLQLAQLLAATGQESDLLHEYAISKVQQIYGEDHLEVLLATMQWSELIAQRGGATRAAKLLKPVLDTVGAVYGSYHWGVLKARKLLIRSAVSARQWSAAVSRQSHYSVALEALHGAEQVQAATASCWSVGLSWVQGESSTPEIGGELNLKEQQFCASTFDQIKPYKRVPDWTPIEST